MTMWGCGRVAGAICAAQLACQQHAGARMWDFLGGSASFCHAHGGAHHVAGALGAAGGVRISYMAPAPWLPAWRANCLWPGTATWARVLPDGSGWCLCDAIVRPIGWTHVTMCLFRSMNIGVTSGLRMCHTWHGSPPAHGHCASRHSHPKFWGRHAVLLWNKNVCM